MNFAITFKGPFDLETTKTYVNNTTEFTYPETIQNKINQEREEKVKQAEVKGKKLRNGMNYGLKDFKNDEGILELRIEKIDFKTFIGGRDYAKEINKKLDFSEIANGIYVSTLLRDKNGDYIFGYTGRNNFKEEGQLSGLGGVVSFDDGIILDSKDLFQQLYRELKEELNIDQKYIIESKILGGILGIEKLTFGIFFTTQLNITFEEVRELHREENDGEIQDLFIVEANNLKEFLIKKGKGTHFEKSAELL